MEIIRWRAIRISRSLRLCDFAKNYRTSLNPGCELPSVSQRDLKRGDSVLRVSRDRNAGLENSGSARKVAFRKAARAAIVSVH